MKSAIWIGVDADASPSRIAWAKRDFFTGKIVSGVSSPDEMGGLFLAGRTVVALPPSVLFAERIDLPPRASLAIARGQLDVRLPVPVEDCLVLSGARPKGTGDATMAYAVTKKDFEAFLARFQDRHGFSPERVVPAAAVLWRKLASLLPDGRGCSVHLHAQGPSWILLAGGKDALSAVVTVPAGDVASVARNSAILALRQKKDIASFTLSGADADDQLAVAISEASPAPSCRIRVVPDPSDFLALALAEEGAERDLAPDGNFRDPEFPHPAASRRLLARAVAVGAFLVLLGLSSLLIATAERARARTALSTTMERLTDISCRLAGRKLPVTGAAALEMARNEFDQRLNPVVEAFPDTRLFGAMVVPLELALTRNLTFSSIQLEGRLTRFTGKALSEDDLTIWRRRAREAGMSSAIESAPSDDGASLVFTATQFCPEVAP